MAGNVAAQSSTNESAQEFLSGKLSHVDVAAIEKELKALWKKAEASGDEGKPSTVMRACSFNMILTSQDDDAETVCNELLDELLVHRPGRGILSITRPDKPHRLDAWVSARCHLEGSSKQICAEQITVCCEGGVAKELSSVVLPLVIADLPVFIYWRGKIENDSTFQALAVCASRLIVDSMRMPFDLKHVQRINEIIVNMRDCLVVSDLNWRRLSGWMRAMADAFDGFPLPGDYLPKFKKVTVTTVGSGNDALSTQSLLLVGWLASRLGWKLSKPLQGNAIQYTGANARPVSAIFVAGKGQEPGHVVGVECEFEDGRTLAISSEKTEEVSYIVAHTADSGHKEATRADYDLAEWALLGQEVDNLSRDSIYEAAVQAAAVASSQ
jgi:glucose-6-phosphate dehydrogenase assembly protein OpcA